VIVEDGLRVARARDRGALQVQLLGLRVSLGAEVGAAEGEEQVLAPRGQPVQRLGEDLDRAVVVPVAAEALAQQHPLLGLHALHQVGMVERPRHALGGIVVQLLLQETDAEDDRRRRAARRLEHLHPARVQVTPARGVAGGREPLG